MNTRNNSMIDDDGEVRELKGADFKGARPASEAFPGSLRAKLGMRGSASLSEDTLAAPARAPMVVSRADRDTLRVNLGEFYELDHVLLKHTGSLKVQLFNHMARTVATRHSVTIRVGEDVAHPLGLDRPGLMVSAPEVSYERFSKIELVNLLTAQTELLERCKTWMTFWDAEEPSSPLGAEVHAAVIARRLRDIAEDLESFGVEQQRA